MMTDETQKLLKQRLHKWFYILSKYMHTAPICSRLVEHAQLNMERVGDQ